MPFRLDPRRVGLAGKGYIEGNSRNMLFTSSVTIMTFLNWHVTCSMRLRMRK